MSAHPLHHHQYNIPHHQPMTVSGDKNQIFYNHLGQQPQSTNAYQQPQFLPVKDNNDIKGNMYTQYQQQQQQQQIYKTNRMAKQKTGTELIPTRQQPLRQQQIVADHVKPAHVSRNGEPGGIIFGLESHQFVNAMDSLLDQLTWEGSRLMYDPQCQLITSFHQKQVPSVSIKRYLERIMKYSHCSDECYVLALVYLDRIVYKNPSFFISSYNIHRLLITSIMEAIKFFDDRYYNNAHYARVGGVSCREINILESEFLTLMDYDLHVTPRQFETFKHSIIQHHNRSTSSTIPRGNISVMCNDTKSPEATDRVNVSNNSSPMSTCSPDVDQFYARQHYPQQQQLTYSHHQNDFHQYTHRMTDD